MRSLYFKFVYNCKSLNTKVLENRILNLSIIGKAQNFLIKKLEKHEFLN